MAPAPSTPAAKTPPAPLGLELAGWSQVVAGLPAPAKASDGGGRAKSTPVVTAVAVPVSASAASAETAFEPAMSAGLY